jgi:hypothetical protein
MACGAASSQDEQPDTQPENSAAPAASGGLRAYLDPATGRLIDHPPYGKPTLELSEELLYGFSDSGFGLIEQRMPDGGLMIDLQGRFRQGSTATTQDGVSEKLHPIGSEIFLSPAGQKQQERLLRSLEENPDGKSGK